MFAGRMSQCALCLMFSALILPAVVWSDRRGIEMDFNPEPSRKLGVLCRCGCSSGLPDVICEHRFLSRQPAVTESPGVRVGEAKRALRSFGNERVDGSRVAPRRCDQRGRDV